MVPKFSWVASKIESFVSTFVWLHFKFSSSFVKNHNYAVCISSCPWALQISDAWWLTSSTSIWLEIWCQIPIICRVLCCILGPYSHIIQKHRPAWSCPQAAARGPDVWLADCSFPKSCSSKVDEGKEDVSTELNREGAWGSHIFNGSRTCSRRCDACAYCLRCFCTWIAFLLEYLFVSVFGLRWMTFAENTSIFHFETSRQYRTSHRTWCFLGLCLKGINKVFQREGEFPILIVDFDLTRNSEHWQLSGATQSSM